MAARTGRRGFLKASAAGLVMGGFAASSRGYAANETINVGCIGTGGRCRQLMGYLKNLPGVQINAVCDVWDENLQKGLELAAPGAFSTKDYQLLLARADIDAVLIGAPDHWHVPMAIDACHAGKDVYVEKPLTHDLREGAPMIRAQQETGRVVQVGMQQRSMPHLQEARELVKKGELGQVVKVHLTWNRNTQRSARGALQIDPGAVDWSRFLGSAPRQQFDPYRYRHWRWFWDFGGGIFTDLMVHYIDVAHWFLDLQAPVSATSVGNFFTNEGDWETPDTVQTLLRYEEPAVQIYFEGTFANARNAAMMEFMGRDATLYCDRGRYEFHPEPGRKLAYRELVLGSGPRGADFFDQPCGEELHLGNWLECIRTRATPNAPVEAGVRAAAAAHLANQALRSGEVVTEGSRKDERDNNLRDRRGRNQRPASAGPTPAPGRGRIGVSRRRRR